MGKMSLTSCSPKRDYTQLRAFVGTQSCEMHQCVLERTMPRGFSIEEEDPRMNFTLDLRNPTPVPFETKAEYTRPQQGHTVPTAVTVFGIGDW